MSRIELDVNDLQKIIKKQKLEIKNLNISLNAHVKITELNVQTIKKLKEEPKKKIQKEQELKLKNDSDVLRNSESKFKIRKFA